MISFESTEIAFEHKSDKELKRARFLFSSISNPVFLNISKNLLRLGLKLHLPLAWAVKPTIYKHFTGGESIEECASTVSQLASFRAKSILVAEGPAGLG